MGTGDAGEIDALLAELHAEHREAAQLLGIASFLAGEPVPAWLLAEQADALPEPLSSRAAAGTGDLLLAAEPLVDAGLAGREEGGFRLDADAAREIRDRMSGRERGEFARTAIHVLFRAFPDRVGRPEDRDRSRSLAPHVRAAARHPRGGGRTTAEAVHTLARLGAFHRTEEEPDPAEEAFRAALEVAERGTPVEGPLRAVVADELAGLLAARGAREEALEMAARAGELALESLPGESPRLPMLLSNVATTFREAGDPEGAVRWLREALERLERAGVESARPLRVELLSEVADAELAREGWDAAREAAERAVELGREHWGAEHPHTARAAWMVGDALRGRGEMEAAAGAFRRALSWEEELQGPGHPAVGQKALGLGRHLEDAGRPGEAREAYARAVRAFEASLGEDSEAAVAARRHLERLAGEGG